jgi:cell filamentation protein
VNPYVDAATGTPYNKLGIADRAELAKVEYALTDLRIAELKLSAPPGDFDLPHLRAVHRHIFQDLYEWAGNDRTLNLSKRDPLEPWWQSAFARPEQFAMIDQSVRADLDAWNRLKGLDGADFAAKIAVVYVKWNHMHPFPEGNGRATQTFLAQLAKESGYELNYAKVDPKDWNAAAARSMPQANAREPLLTRPADAQFIHRVFQQIVEPTRARQVERTTGMGIEPKAKSNAGYER